MRFKTLLFICILFAFTNAATAQLGMAAGALGTILNKKREKKEKAAAEKAAKEQAVKDSIDNENIKLARIADQHRKDSLDEIAVIEEKRQDSINGIKTKAKVKETDDPKTWSYFRPNWEKLGMDSVEFCNHYGSDYEYRIQKQQAADSWCKYTTFLYGVKYGYTDYIVSYLESKGWEYDMKKTVGLLKFKLTHHNYETDYNEVINMSFPLDKNNRIIGGTITGTSSVIIDLYVDYWSDGYSAVKSLPNSDGTYIMHGSDKITLKWSAGKPVITISKGQVSFQFQEHFEKHGGGND